MNYVLGAIFSLAAGAVVAETRGVYLQDLEGQRIRVATLNIADDGTYDMVMDEAPFNDHFLSMRPFKCLEGPQKHWCHVPYPYEIARNISADLTDLEYDLLFVWKGATDYGINMWNGVYYQLEQKDGVVTGALFEMDMDTLSAPPPAGELRPLRASDLHESDPESHWLPHIIIE